MLVDPENFPRQVNPKARIANRISNPQRIFKRLYYFSHYKFCW